MNMKDKILDITPGMEDELDSWFTEKLETHINNGLYPNEGELTAIKQSIVDELSAYSDKYQIEDVVIGMSGGVDSALTAALFKEAGWTVHGVTMPIHQNQEETDRGLENIEALGLESHSYDLSEQFDSMQNFIIDDKNPRWNVAAGFIPDKGDQYISNVNGINTYLGGTHVNHVVDNIVNTLKNDYILKEYSPKS